MHPDNSKLIGLQATLINILVNSNKLNTQGNQRQTGKWLFRMVSLLTHEHCIFVLQCYQPVKL